MEIMGRYKGRNRDGSTPFGGIYTDNLYIHRPVHPKEIYADSFSEEALYNKETGILRITTANTVDALISCNSIR